MIHSIKMGIVQVFVVPCTGGYLLVDSGYPGSLSVIKRRLSTLGIGMTDVRYLLLTHNHIDHCGSSAEIREASGARLIVHKNLVPFIAAGDGGLDGAQPVSVGMRGMMGLLRRLSTASDRFPALIIREGDLIVDETPSDLLRGLGIPAQLLFTPGHTNNSLTMVFDDGDVICGDIVFNSPLFQLLGSRYRPILIQDEKLVKESWQKIRAAGGKRLYPSHGAMLPVEKLKI